MPSESRLHTLVIAYVLLGSQPHLGTREHHTDCKNMRSEFAGYADENANLVQEVMDLLELFGRKFAGMFSPLWVNRPDTRRLVLRSCREQYNYHVPAEVLEHLGIGARWKRE